MDKMCIDIMLYVQYMCFPWSLMPIGMPDTMQT